MIKWLKLLNAFRLDFIFYFNRKFQAVEWRIRNKHNYTQLSLNVKDSKIIEVGNYSYGIINVESFENKNERLIIGNFVSIAPQVTFLLGGNHQMLTFTTYPLKTFLLGCSPEDDAMTKGPIIVEDEVWIGQGCIILSGVKIGKGAIVAAGSIVTKDVPAFAMVGGNPAKFLKWRIDEALLSNRASMDLSDFKPSMIRKNIDIFYSNVTMENLEDLKEILEDGN